YAVQNRQNLGVQYVIWNRQYYGPENGYNPVPYTATSNPHTDHVHITFTDQPAAWTSTPGFAPPARASLTAATDTCAWALNYPSISAPGVSVGGQSCILTKKAARQLAGSLVLTGGVIVGLVGVILLMVYGLSRPGARNILPPGLRRVI